MIEQAGRVTSLGYIQIGFAMIWHWSVFGDPPTAWTLGGAALIVAGTLVVARSAPAADGSPSHTPTSPAPPA